MTNETDTERSARQAREHVEKYEALAQWLGIDALKALVPFSVERIEAALTAGDEHLNTLPLASWDAKHGADRRKSELYPCCKQMKYQSTEELGSGVLGLWRAARQRDGVAPLEAIKQGWSLSDTVCVLKHVARHHVARQEP